MKRKLVYYFLLFAFVVNAQTFEKKIGFVNTANFQETEGGGVFATSKNNVLVLSNFKYGSDFWSAISESCILKMDNELNILEIKKLPFPIKTFYGSITELVNGNILITTDISYSGGIIMLDSNLNILWTKEYDNIHYNRLVHTIETSDNNLLSVGTSGGANVGQAGTYILKLDLSGNIIWGKTIGIGGDDDGWDVVEIDEYYYVLGYGTGYYGYTVPHLFKLNSNGELIWAKVIRGQNGIGGGNCRRISKTSDNKLLLSLESGYSLVGQNTSKNDIYVSKLDTNGVTQIWTKRLGNVTYNKIATTLLDEDDNVFVSGFLDFDTTYRSLGITNETIPFLLKMDEEGELIWSHEYSDINKDTPASLVNYNSNITLNTKGIIMSTFATDNDGRFGFLKLLNENGTFLCSQNLNFPCENSLLEIVDVTSSCDIYSAGVAADYQFSYLLAPQYNEINSCVDGSEIKEPNQAKCLVYPNPTNGSQQLNFDTQVHNVQVFNVIGELIYSAFGDDVQSITISDFKPGTYLIQATSVSQASFIQKLVVN